jgi:ankyrin repeat protein
MSKAGVFVLKIALLRRDDDEIKRLVGLGAEINLKDQHGRNLLHIAINMSSSTADATFETEQLLIDLGVELNVRDIRGRVPLHYAFVKLKQHGDSTQIDPIETVSSLCARKDLDIEVPDKWNKTPLHYAAQRSATISSLYILQRGA